MSLMDLFKSKGSAKPSSGSKEGDWKDWFLDMKGRRPFGKSASPTAGSEKGDLMDWYLNRTGPFGKFNREEEEYDYLDYNPYMLFNEGGSVRRTSRGQGVTSSRDNTDTSSGFFGPLKGARKKFQRLGQTPKPHELMPELNQGNTNREQAIMNQYTRPRGGTYTGGNPITDTMAALMGGMNRPQLEGITQMAGAPGFMPNYMWDYDDPDETPSYISPSTLEMDMLPSQGLTDWEGRWTTTDDPDDWSSLGMGGNQQMAKIYNNQMPGMIDEGFFWDSVAPQGEAINKVLNMPGIEGMRQGSESDWNYDDYNKMIPNWLREQLPEDAFENLYDFRNQQRITT